MVSGYTDTVTQIATVSNKYRKINELLETNIDYFVYTVGDHLMIVRYRLGLFKPGPVNWPTKYMIILTREFDKYYKKWLAKLFEDRICILGLRKNKFEKF